ncbi:MAG: formyltransferase family protein [Patescibacteria group bacterium]
MKIFLFCNYQTCYEIIRALTEEKVKLVGVLFAPCSPRDLGWKQRIKNLFSDRSFKEASKLLKKHEIPFHFVDSYNDLEAESILRKSDADVLLLYGTKIIKPNILSIPKVGTLNAHSALLPKYRGSKSEFWLLYKNEPQFAGVTIHWVTPGLDEGDIFLQQPLKVDVNETPETLRQKSRSLAGALFVKAINNIINGAQVRRPQEEDLATKYKRPSSETLRLFADKYGKYNRIDHATNWLLKSGIQNEPGTKTITGVDASGSFNAWFDMDKRNYSYIYSEISGYALTTLLYLYQASKKAVYLDRANGVASWLLKTQHPAGQFQTAFYMNVDSQRKPENFHTFDTGVILNGLVNYFRVTSDPNYLSSAKRSADWLISTMTGDGSVPAMISHKDNSRVDFPDTWSTQSGPYHAKLAIGLLNLFDVTKEIKYQNAARAFCDYALSKMTQDGQFYTYESFKSTNFHPHAYTCEGLYVAGKYLNEPRYFDAAKKGTEWAVSLIKNGIVPRHIFDGNPNYNERVDVMAQIYRLALLFDIKSESMLLLHNNLLSNQYFGEVQEQRGGFIFGKSSDGKPLEHINSWVTMFALQAMMLSKSANGFNEFHLI